MTDKLVLLINPDGTAEVNGVKGRWVPVDCITDALTSLGAFCSDHGWSQEDMDNMDRLEAAAIDLSGLPRVPDKFTDPNDDLEQMFADGWNQALDAMGVK